jgi:outer membrane protein assembly factor BamB
MNKSGRRQFRWNWAVCAVVLAALAVVFVQITDRIEGNFKFPWTLGVLVLAVLVLDVLMLLGGLQRRAKLAIVTAQLLVVIGGGVFIQTFLKMQSSYTGAGVPRFVWKWTLPPDASLPAPPASVVKNAVDLTATNLDWPQFLGPHRDDSVDDPGLSTDWAAHPPRQLWRQPVGAGWGSFAIVNGFAITEEQRGKREITTCLEAKTGDVRWQHVNIVRFSEGMGGDGPRATPTIVDGRVYVMGATGILDCLDGATGSTIWSRDILADVHAKNLTWGKSCSPLVIDQMVIVTGGDAPGPAVLAYDKQSGKPVWQSGTDQSAYCSATLAMIAGRREITVVNGHSVSGCDLADGSPLWSFGWPGNFPKVSQTVPFSGDRIFISAGYNLGGIMLHIATDGRGNQSVEKLWSTRSLMTEFTNIAVKDGYIYGLDDGALTCFDSTNGNQKWRHRGYGHGQILRAGALLIVQAEGGEVSLVEATPATYHEMGTLSALTSKTWNNPALSGHLLLVRNDQEAACYELP